MKVSVPKRAKKEMLQPVAVLHGAVDAPHLLTKDLVMFTDNQNPVNLLALDMKTGETVASHASHR